LLRAFPAASGGAIDVQQSNRILGATAGSSSRVRRVPASHFWQASSGTRSFNNLNINKFVSRRERRG
jgi:hypothetical protein